MNIYLKLRIIIHFPIVKMNVRSDMKKKIVLAYSGGLDTTYAIGYLSKTYDCAVVALLIDLGEEKNLAVLEERALKAGAERCYIIDGQAALAEDYLSIAIKANALYEGAYPLISALSRALISKYLVDIAHKEEAFAVAHGCTAKGNDQVRFDFAIKVHDPNIKVIAPLREHPVSRPDAIAYIEDKKIDMPVNKQKPYSIDMNIWGRSCECGALEDPWHEPPADAFELTTAPEDAPNEPEYIELEFANGLPVVLDGAALELRDIIVKLNEIAGKHGVGRIDHLENRIVGIKSRELYEAPAAITIIEAHRQLETLCLLKDVAHYKQVMDLEMASLIYEGQWYSPLFDAMEAFINTTQSHVEGTVRIKLYKGKATVVGTKSDVALYNQELSTYDNRDVFDHSAAEGFLKLSGLPLEVYANVHKSSRK